ncbi:coiled-coil domain-containing protein 191 [Polypterus senegalus]
MFVDNVVRSPSLAGGELYRWKRRTPSTFGKTKPHLTNDDVENWIQKVERASEFAVSEVFSVKKPSTSAKLRSHQMALESTEQLHDHDDAYFEARDLLDNWMTSKLRLDLEVDDENLAISSKDHSLETESQLLTEKASQFQQYNKFDDLYSHLEHEAETATVHSFLQELMAKEVATSGILDDHRMDKEEKPKKDPRLIMELRHQQVKESRQRRQAELEQQRREKLMKKEAHAEAQRLLQEEERLKQLAARKQEEDIQREVVRLRKEMAEQRRIMEKAKQQERERSRMEKTAMEKVAQERTTLVSQALSNDSVRYLQVTAAKQREVEMKIEVRNLRCLQRHFSAWYKLVLQQRMKMGKAGALCDWRRQLRTFRAWRAYVWTRKVEKESQQTEVQLRDDNRKLQMAVENDRQRILRQYLNDWQIWCKAEQEKREMLKRKEETKMKMAAFLEAASSRKFYVETATDEIEQLTLPANEQQPPNITKEEPLPVPARPLLHNRHGTFPNKPQQAWQVTKRHAGLTVADLRQTEAQQTAETTVRSGIKRVELHGSNFENRHAFQRQMIEEQKRQLHEQKEMILELQENQRLIMLRQEAERATAVTNALVTPRMAKIPASKPVPHSNIQNSNEKILNETSSPASNHGLLTEAKSGSPQLKVATQYMAPTHPVVKAMEERAKQRAIRKREIEELKRRKEDEKLAQLQAAEEERRQKEETEKEAQLEKRREEKRLKKQKEQEKQKRLEMQQVLQEKAEEHYHHCLLKNKGLKPWKRLLELSEENEEVAKNHYTSVVLQKYFQYWKQVVNNIIAEKVARANDFYEHLLLQRSLTNWKRYKTYLWILEEKATRYCNRSLKKKTLKIWVEFTKDESTAMWQKQQAAEKYCQRRQILTPFRAWRRFPKFLKEERQKEERIEKLRKKVAEILPDFGS